MTDEDVARPSAAGEELSPGSAAEAAAKTKNVPIVREPSFVRLCADDFVAILHSAAELELSFLVSGPDPAARVYNVDDQGELSPSKELKLARSWGEVGRVRIDTESGYIGAMNLLGQLIHSKSLPEQQVRADLQRLLGLFDASGTESTE